MSRSARIITTAALAVGLLSAAPAFAGTMTFRESNIGQVSYGWDLYEPNVTAVNGAVYATGHSVGAFTTRAPAYVSHDDGLTWESLAPLTGQNQIEGGGHVDGDEGIVSADQNGRAWQFDNGAGTSSLYSYANFGEAETGYNPLAYNELGLFTSKCQMGGDDRPWQAYGDNHLILVNNGFVGNSDQNAMQLSVYDTTTGTQTPWNMCAGAGYIPGVPALGDNNGTFAVPQLQDAKAFKAFSRKTKSRQQRQQASGGGAKQVLAVVRGNASKGVDDKDLTTTPVFGVGATNPGGDDPNEFPCADQGGGSNWGFTAYSKAGSLFATAANSPSHIEIAADSGHGFKATGLDARGQLWFLWISGSETGEGALVTWVSSSKCDNTSADGDPGANFYAAHVLLSGNGAPRVTDVSLVAANIDSPCGDYHGSSAGPDGRAYVAVAGPGCLRAPGDMPLRVYIQNGGPTLP